MRARKLTFAKLHTTGLAFETLLRYKPKAKTSFNGSLLLNIGFFFTQQQLLGA